MRHATAWVIQARDVGAVAHASSPHAILASLLCLLSYTHPRASLTVQIAVDVSIGLYRVPEYLPK
jgi:hypothetical protein